MAQIGKQNSKLDFYFDTNFKSANNEFYNYWVPIYIDEKHYKKNRTTILNSFSIIKYGPRGLKEYDFKPEQIFEILPIILNKMIIGMFNGKSIISTAFIRCYFQYVLLFKKLCLEFEKEYLEYVHHILNLIAKNKYNIDKKIIPDIGNFFMLLFFSNRDTHTPKMKKMWNCLFEEFFTRQIFWMFHGTECKDKIKQIILNKCLNNDSIIKYHNKNKKLPNFKMELINEFIQELQKCGIFEDIINIISSDKDFLFSLEWTKNFTKKDQILNKNDIKNLVNKSMIKDMDTLFSECSNEGIKELLKKLSLNLNLVTFFDINTND